MKRAQAEYTWAIGFAFVVAIVAAVVIWNMGTGSANSSDQFKPFPAAGQGVNESIGSDGKSAIAETKAPPRLAQKNLTKLVTGARAIDAGSSAAACW